MDEQKAVWVVRAGQGGVHAEEFKTHNVAALDFRPVGDLSGKTRKEIFDYTRTFHGSKAPNYGGTLDRFANQMKIGDLIVTPDGQTRQLLYGRVTSAYRFDDQSPITGFQHVRDVEWLGRRDRDPLPDTLLYSIGSVLTVFSPSGQAALAAYLLDGVVPEIDETSTEAPNGDGAATFTHAAEQEARNRELIGRRVARLGPYETQDLVAAIFRAMGYHTKVAPPGADGGVDILAGRDALFLHPPLIKVQVKARPGTKMTAPDVRQLIGVVKPDERGVFVSTGGFTSAAITEFDGNAAMQLVGMELLLDLLLEHYEKLDDESKRLVPLQRVWTLADEELATDE